ncbi:MAG: hypothetical protein QM775_29750 [Pirellulales bacterium]
MLLAVVIGAAVRQSVGACFESSVSAFWAEEAASWSFLGLLGLWAFHQARRLSKLEAA